MEQQTQSERRKQVRLKKRPDLEAIAQRYEGRTFHVIKDPVALKYFRFTEQEYFVFSRLDGQQTLEQLQKEFEKTHRPDRIATEDMESFARQLVQSGLVQHESPNAGRKLFEKRLKQKRMKRLAAVTNILYIKLPLFDPDRLLGWMFRKTRWIFTNTFLFLSVLFMLSALALVAFKFSVFWDKLPAYQEFFRFRTLLYMWISLGIVKVIHEFGHGLSCKAFGGECHQMGFLFMCFSPSLYCNVSDAWTLANKWQRILISFAGIYVELIIAAISTFVWWYTPHWPFVNNIALCLMTLCSVSTFMFNANPLMRFDGYYILADWLEVTNLREKANRFLGRVTSALCLGIESPEPAYMTPFRKFLFVVYAIASWIYRWVITVSILLFLATWLKPYKLETISYMLAIGSLASMIGWPLYKMLRNIKQRGRLPDMKRKRVRITLAVAASALAVFFFVPLPINRVRETGLVEIQDGFSVVLAVPEPGGQLVEQYVQDGDVVKAGQKIAKLRNVKQASKTEQLASEIAFLRDQRNLLEGQIKAAAKDENTQAGYRDEMAKVVGRLGALEKSLETEERLLNDLIVLKAPTGGTVMNAPKKAKMFMFWDKSEAGPFCRIGDRSKLRLLVPVGATEYREIKESLARQKQKNPGKEPALEASILMSNRSDHLYVGKVTTIPDRHEDNIALGLTSRGGGPVAIRPSENQNVNEPVAQTYIVQVEFVDADATILPGAHAKVKIHTQWRSGAWWCSQKIASALDWGLW